MTPVTNGRLLFNAYPDGLPQPGKATRYDGSQTIDPDTVPLNGGFLIKTLVLSIDPFIVAKMRPKTPGASLLAYTIGEPIEDYGVGVVLRSENPAIKAGDHVYGVQGGAYPFAEYVIANDATQYRVLEKKDKLHWSVYVGILGMPGQTAYCGWKEFSKAKKGDVVFVSGGAGPVGSLVIQLAKMDGCKVIASAGSNEKVAFMKKIGADVPFNYKTENTADILKKEGGIDIYWDNVGGTTLEAALDSAKLGAKFIECGMISAFTSDPLGGTRNLFTIIPKQITMNGLSVSLLIPKYEEEFYRVVSDLIASGKIQYGEEVIPSLELGGEALLAVLTGTNKAKVVIEVAKE
ncbi:alcohol dehydrogenase [Neolentinus lepideus HHB14362 ss-1]|uniref:Alcohol dehydrogenase n=1 Tax=Neolentinus lepideus HHB14362 ss-1 TaxID=1314782 RepID=A0A165V6M1_9AGAM|nr:alcohol dehydrogenase [Neolentinus lepideus HHB14362 ss-1]